jgi:hypothetical protein
MGLSRLVRRENLFLHADDLVLALEILVVEKKI